MHLWNDYEGKTIAGSFPLERLLRPEGRSAFFSTSNGTGTPAVIRLLEALNDEQEILARWGVVADIKQINLVAIRNYGQTEFDGTPLIYAVMEPTDANLADVLKERPLTAEETRQVGTSLVAALEALHARDIIHEHVEPSNVLAAGEVIKLRSDCIREAPAGAEGNELKARDVHDLSVVLLQALTQGKQLNRIDATPLPAPFEEIIRNGISGVWGLQQIAAALGMHTRRPAVPAGAAVSATPAKSVKATAPVPPPSPVSVATPAPVSNSVKRPTAPSRGRADLAETQPRRTELWVGGGIAALLLILLVGHFLRTGSTGPATGNPNRVPAATAPVVQTAAPLPNAGVARSGAKPSGALRGQTVTSGRVNWRVVAYTYNHASQAKAKVESISKQHASLKPEVFTPNGLPPYLVTLGGPMTRDEAVAFKKKARAAGFPHDIYAQNYSAGAR